MRTVLSKRRTTSADARRRFAEQLIDGASRLPGVESAATTTFVPSGDSNATARARHRTAAPDDGPGRRPIAAYRAVSIEVLRHDAAPAPRGPRVRHDATPRTRCPVAIVSQALANRLWPGESALGRRLQLADADDKRWMTVVGVAGNIIDDWFSRRNGPMLYVPHAAAAVVHHQSRRCAPAAIPRRSRANCDGCSRRSIPSQPPVHVMTMKGMLHERTVGLQMIGAMMGVLGALAVVLAAIGLYSLMAYHVSQRRHEIGVRMALGASQGAVVRHTIRRAWWLASAGVVIGLVPAYLLTGVLRGVLFNVVSIQPDSSPPSCVALVGIAVVASLIPARQAARVDPAVALRSE